MRTRTLKLYNYERSKPPRDLTALWDFSALRELYLADSDLINFLKGFPFDQLAHLQILSLLRLSTSRSQDEKTRRLLAGLFKITKELEVLNIGFPGSCNIFLPDDLTAHILKDVGQTLQKLELIDCDKGITATPDRLRRLLSDCQCITHLETMCGGTFEQVR